APPREQVPLALLRPPRLAGRKRELGVLAGHNHGVLLIAGEPGIGKTRLLGETAPDGALHLSCREGLERVPYQPVAALVRQRHQAGSSLPDLGGYLEDLLRLVPELAIYSPAAPADPELSRGRLLEAL